MDIFDFLQTIDLLYIYSLNPSIHICKLIFYTCPVIHYVNWSDFSNKRLSLYCTKKEMNGNNRSKVYPTK